MDYTPEQKKEMELWIRDSQEKQALRQANLKLIIENNLLKSQVKNMSSRLVFFSVLVAVVLAIVNIIFIGVII
jgi:hypothetical protein